ncbi:YjgN family protein [soil metagenome]
MNQMTTICAPQRKEPVGVTFSGGRREFRVLVTSGAQLELVTAGFYRFWLATDIRRHLWSNTSIDGDALEYTGRGRELLTGFLVAMAVLMPAYLAYFLLGLEAERYQAFASTPLFILFLLFGKFAVYRARRYRLSRTVFRGVRFSMTGSGWSYAWRAGLWGLLVSATFGLALPWRDAALERYKMQHSWYGTLQGRFDGAGADLFWSGWWLWLLSACSLVALILSANMPGLLLIALPLPVFIYAAFKALQWRWWLSGIRYGGVRLESTLPRKAFVDLYWKVIGWSLLLLGGFALYLMAGAKVASLLYGVPLETFFRSPALLMAWPLLAYAALGYLVLALAVSVVVRVYLVRDLWVAVTKSISIRGIESAASVAARGELASALGEGFADGLDVAGF